MYPPFLPFLSKSINCEIELACLWHIALENGGSEEEGLKPDFFPIVPFRNEVMQKMDLISKIPTTAAIFSSFCQTYLKAKTKKTCLFDASADRNSHMTCSIATNVDRLEYQ